MASCAWEINKSYIVGKFQCKHCMKFYKAASKTQCTKCGYDICLECSKRGFDSEKFLMIRRTYHKFEEVSKKYVITKMNKIPLSIRTNCWYLLMRLPSKQKITVFDTLKITNIWVHNTV